MFIVGIEVILYTFNFLGDTLFKRLQYIDELVVKGNVNNKNPDEVIDQITYIDQDINLTNTKKFYEPVRKTFLVRKLALYLFIISSK